MATAIAVMAFCVMPGMAQGIFADVNGDGSD